jgi:hypothetical protein
MIFTQRAYQNRIQDCPSSPFSNDGYLCPSRNGDLIGFEDARTEPDLPITMVFGRLLEKFRVITEEIGQQPPRTLT